MKHMRALNKKAARIDNFARVSVREIAYPCDATILDSHISWDAGRACPVIDHAIAYDDVVLGRGAGRGRAAA